MAAYEMVKQLVGKSRGLCATKHGTLVPKASFLLG